jgi:hypothetical protein
MRISNKVLLVLEVIVCFTPMTLMWLAGIALSPFVFGSAFSESFSATRVWEGPVLLLGFVGCGLCGLVTLFFLLSRLLGRQRPVARPALVLAGAALGVLPISPFLLLPEAWQALSVLMPIAATAHILYLSRRILFPRSAREGLTT